MTKHFCLSFPHYITHNHWNFLYWHLMAIRHRLYLQFFQPTAMVLRQNGCWTQFENFVAKQRQEHKSHYKIASINRVLRDHQILVFVYTWCLDCFAGDDSGSRRGGRSSRPRRGEEAGEESGGASRSPSPSPGERRGGRATHGPKDPVTPRALHAPRGRPGGEGGKNSHHPARRHTKVSNV